MRKFRRERTHKKLKIYLIGFYPLLVKVLENSDLRGIVLKGSRHKSKLMVRGLRMKNRKELRRSRREVVNSLLLINLKVKRLSLCNLRRDPIDNKVHQMETQASRMVQSLQEGHQLGHKRDKVVSKPQINGNFQAEIHLVEDKDLLTNSRHPKKIDKIRNPVKTLLRGSFRIFQLDRKDLHMTINPVSSLLHGRSQTLLVGHKTVHTISRRKETDKNLNPLSNQILGSIQIPLVGRKDI